MAKRTSKKSKSSSPNSRIPKLCIILGVILLLNFAVWKLHQTYIAYITTPPTSYSISHNLNAHAPTNILIPKVGLNVAITEAAIKDGIWGVSKDNASHLVTSSNPGEDGNIIIYGHNKKNIFGSLENVAIGDTIIVQDVKNKYHTYKIISVKTTVHTDTSILTSFDKEKLVVYTCTGLFDSKRLIVSAIPS